MRGKACRSVAGCALRRITPACAGKSHRELFCLYRGPDHPRVCGEKGSSQDGHERQPGSPPRVRGKDPQIRVGAYQPGITPACAGKSKQKCNQSHFGEDHPRVCGEKGNGAVAAQTVVGSPPRVRGKALLLVVKLTCLGITPACSGKRLRLGCRKSQTEDHPRVCGEKRKSQAGCALEKGSPPRVRGKAFKAAEKLGVERITPACAGKR